MLVGGDYFRNLQNRKAELYYVKEPHNIFATKLDEVKMQNLINSDEKDILSPDMIAYNMQRK